jgi:S-adenosylmethionine decarboxylase
MEISSARLRSSTLDHQLTIAGTHLLVDLYGCARAALDDEEGIRSLLLEAARRSGAHVVDDTFHRFPGGGVTGVVAVEESHLTIHTWPHVGYAALDVFFCGRPDPAKATQYVMAGLKPSHIRFHRRMRGHGIP